MHVFECRTYTDWRAALQRTSKPAVHHTHAHIHIHIHIHINVLLQWECDTGSVLQAAQTQDCYGPKERTSISTQWQSHTDTGHTHMDKTRMWPGRTFSSWQVDSQIWLVGTTKAPHMRHVPYPPGEHTHTHAHTFVSHLALNDQKLMTVSHVLVHETDASVEQPHTTGT